MKNFLRVLFTPSCWFQGNMYSAEWDRQLKELLKTYRFTEIGEHTAKLGSCVVWIANHPYASFSPYNMDARPKRSTVLLAHERLVRDSFRPSEHEELERIFNLRDDRGAA